LKKETTTEEPTMNISARASRRLAFGLGLACAAVLLPTAALAASGGPSAASAAPTTRCLNTQTRVWVGQPGDGTTGPTFFQLEFSNIGHSPCTFFGYPGISMLNSHGQVGKPASRAPSAIPLITLQPGQTVHVVLGAGIAADYCGRHAVSTQWLKVYPPNQFNSQPVPFPWQGCAGKVTMSTDAVHPGTGIPLYTIR